MSSLVLGIDVGTTSVSVVAIDEGGQLEASVTLPHGANVAALPPGYAEQAPELLWQAVTTALSQVTDRIHSGDVQAVGLTGQMHSALLLDDEGAPCSNVITWQDKRSVVREIDDSSVFDVFLSRISPDAMEATGCRLAPGYMGTTLFALQQSGEMPANQCSATFVADWIGGRLCDRPPVTDRSHAASSGLYDFRIDDWSPTLLDAADVNPSWLPDVQPSGAVIGAVSAQVADVTGLTVGTKVCNAMGDNQASVLSSLPADEKSLLINIGTGGQIVWRIPAFRRINGMDTRYLPGASTDTGEHVFMLVGAGLCGGDAFAWVNRTVRQWLRDFGVETSEEEIWQHLAAQLENIPDDLPPLSCEPFFVGTRPDPSRRGIFRDVGSANFTPANVARSILQGIADTMQNVFESAVGSRPEPLQEIAMSGNGARQNPLLVEAVSQRFGVPTVVAPCREEAATGAAMLAGVRTGMWPDLGAAQKRIHNAAAETT